jgi:hypothetical protein
MRLGPALVIVGLLVALAPASVLADGPDYFLISTRSPVTAGDAWDYTVTAYLYGTLTPDADYSGSVVFTSSCTYPPHRWLRYRFDYDQDGR